MNPKATFYLPTSLIDRLEKVWLAARAKKRKLTKSDIVRELLDVGLTQKEKDLHI